MTSVEKQSRFSRARHDPGALVRVLRVPRPLAEPQLGDERQRRYIRDLIELLPVDGGQLFRHLPRRTGESLAIPLPRRLLLRGRPRSERQRERQSNPDPANDRATVGHERHLTNFVSDRNEFPVPNTLRDQTNLYRGGVRLEFKRFHATVEEGGTTFKDDQSVYMSSGTINYGNVSSPLLGQTIYLSHLLEAYGIRGNSVYTKALFTANATGWPASASMK